MNTRLAKTKDAACKWADTFIPSLPFVLAVSSGSRRGWQEQATTKSHSITEEPGIYLIYPLGKKTPVYVGAATDLRERLTYHFAESASSHKNCTLKKNLRRDGLWDGKTPIRQCFCLRCFPVSFGRAELEEHLHRKYHINTSRSRK